MRRKIILSTFITLAMMTQAHTNKLLEPFATPYGSAPFTQITVADYAEAIDLGIAKANAEIDAITSNPEAPTFANTIVALEKVGSDLNRALMLFENLAEADSDDAMMQLSMEVSPKLSAYSTGIILNEPLWQRICTVWEDRANLNLDTEDVMLLEKTHDSFALSGANLEGADREAFKEISSRLSELTTLFGQNVLKELNTYEVYLGADDLAGLPADLVSQAAADAAEHGRQGEYRFTLAAPTYIAFMKYSDRRDLREKMYRLYSGRNLSGEFSNIDNMIEIARLRALRANLLGSKTYAEQSLKRTMAGNPAAVYRLLDQLRDAYRPALDKELQQLQEFADSIEGGKAANPLMPWDYSYYNNKLKASLYDYDEEELRPYFQLENTIQGVFGLATRLYGVTFNKLDNVEVYHPDVTAWEVKDADGSYLGLLYTDFFPRDSKRPGAWMTSFKDQYVGADGKDSRPHISIVMNFTKPTPDKPSLLTPYEVETFLHEFGHALHGLLTKCRYETLSGTSVYRDFVELPSQFNENYLTEPEYLNTFARHYVTGEAIPQALIDKIVKSSQHGAAYQCLRQLGFGYVDMAWHTQPAKDGKLEIEATATDNATLARDIENKALKQVEIFPVVDGTMTSSTFSHIFSGGYAAGYYSYKWAEVLDADAFAHFKEHGIFDPETAASFRHNILERGGTEDPAVLYRRFRGQDPGIDALLQRDGIK